MRQLKHAGIALSAVLIMFSLLPAFSIQNIGYSNNSALANTDPDTHQINLTANSDNVTEEQAVEETTLGRPQPEITAVEIYSDPGCTQPALSLTPQTTYYAKVNVKMRMGNQLSHLREVRVTIFYDSAGTNPPPPGRGNSQTCGILLCIITLPNIPPLWVIDAGIPTSWQILPTECQYPDLRQKEGSWIFAFKPGKVATASPPGNWDVCAKATTKLGEWDELCIWDKAMNWYGEVIIFPALLDWGEVAPGTRFENTPPNPRTLTAIYIANGSYGVDIKSEDWSSGTATAYLDETGGNPPAGENQFALKVSASGGLSNAITIRKEYVLLDEGTRTGEGGRVQINSFWLSLSQSDIPSGTYSGTVYYRITQR